MTTGTAFCTATGVAMAEACAEAAACSNRYSTMSPYEDRDWHAKKWLWLLFAQVLLADAASWQSAGVPCRRT